MSNNYQRIPVELRKPKCWLQYYLSPDPKHPDKKPRKHPEVTYRTPEERESNLRSLDYLLENRTLKKGGGYQRWMDPEEGFVYIDLDHVRNPETGAIESWAEKIINALDTYTEVSASGTGFHLVCRAKIGEDFARAGNRVEIYGSGRIANKLLAMTGAIFGLQETVEARQLQANDLLIMAKLGQLDPNAVLSDSAARKLVEPENWRAVFHTGAELDPTPSKIFIAGILEEGIAAFGALSAVGKTWIGLSVSHALITGEPLFGFFPVKNRTNVLYLVPEMGTGKFRERMVKMHLPMDGSFFCQTLADGVCNLGDPVLIAAIEEMKPTVILDTAIRFNVTDDENQAINNASGLAAALFRIRMHGAPLVIAMHHRSKATRGETLTLENTLRGTGDFGAMCDIVWGVEHDCRKSKNGAIDEAHFEESQNLTRLHLKCVKPRDMEPADPFRIQGRPHIDERGDFRVLAGEAEKPEGGDTDEARLDAFLRANPKASGRAIERHIGAGHERVDRMLASHKWTKANGEWAQGAGDEQELGIG